MPAVREDLSRIICWCGVVFQAINADGTAWDESQTGSVYKAHCIQEGPPPTPAAAQQAQNSVLGVTATIDVTLPLAPVVNGLLGGQQ